MQETNQKDWLYKLQIQCFEWGMQPSEFRECTLLDIGNYMVGNLNRYKTDMESKRKERYELAKIIATMNSVNLANMSSKIRKDYPSYEKMFGGKEKANKDNPNVYTYIDDSNKSEFLHKQLQAYKNMGYKI